MNVLDIYSFFFFLSLLLFTLYFSLFYTFTQLHNPTSCCMLHSTFPLHFINPSLTLHWPFIYPSFTLFFTLHFTLLHTLYTFTFKLSLLHFSYTSFCTSSPLFSTWTLHFTGLVHFTKTQNHKHYLSDLTKLFLCHTSENSKVWSL